jgi:hypothetical protein
MSRLKAAYKGSPLTECSVFFWYEPNNAKIRKLYPSDDFSRFQTAGEIWQNDSISNHFHESKTLRSQ